MSSKVVPKRSSLSSQSKRAESRARSRAVCRDVCVLAALIAVSVSCGAPGAPLPPSLYLPQPVTDLKAIRKGESVTLSWTAPMRTTDHLPVRAQGITDICRGEQAPMTVCRVPVGNVPSEVSDVAKTQKFVDTLPEKILTNDVTADIAYGVDARNSNGRSAGLSNQVRVPAVRTPSAPSGLQVRGTSDGLQVIWNAVSLPPSASGIHCFYRVFRREDGKGAATVAGELPLSDSEPVFVDHNFEWEKSYDYRVTVVTVLPQTQIEGDDSSEVKIFAHDVFPPATPSGLQAVFSDGSPHPFIDLVWSPDLDADLNGYNVYRSESSAAAVKINKELLKTPAFRDVTVSSGTTYSYSVSAVDVRGNESARSAVATETVPK
jgi:hypothetical protein